MKKANVRFLKIILIFFLLSDMTSANSTESYDKGWAVATIIGTMPQSTSFKYYLEPQLRVIDDTYFFNQFLILGGFGYQFKPNLILFIGPGWIVTKTTDNIMIHENRYWQQLNWRVWDNPDFNLNSRTRLEERKNTREPQLSFRFRERMWLRIPFKHWEPYSLSLYDEAFFNLNHPQWVSPYRFEQNRAFVGISRTLFKSILLDVGYLNQYSNSFVKQVDNVLLLSLTITN